MHMIFILFSAENDVSSSKLFTDFKVKMLNVAM